MEVRDPVMWLTLMCYIFGHIITSHNKGFIEAKSLSKFEDLEIQRKLKTINKPAVKIIKTIHGERYVCVDFFKQPAFDHPSMKNHTNDYMMRRIWNPEKNGVGCPIGTVPIRRLTKDDLLSLNSLDDDKYSKPRGSWNTTTYDPNNDYAAGRTKDIGMRYNGATMDLCISNLSLTNLVNPALYYKDNLNPRLFVYTKAGWKSCYNSHCDVGMISVCEDFPMGAALKPVSVYS
ncbi:hypothetical protein EUTSA_v10027231mg, partial [Eutrema salsugineum]